MEVGRSFCRHRKPNPQLGGRFETAIVRSGGVTATALRRLIEVRSDRPAPLIGGDDDAGVLVEFRDEVEEQHSASLGEGEIAEFIDHDEVEPGR